MDGHRRCLRCRVVRGLDWRLSILASLAQWWAWGLVALLIVAADGRLPFSARQFARRIATHLLLSLPLTLAYFFVYGALLALLGTLTWRAVFDTQIFLGALRNMFLWSWLVYWLIIGRRPIVYDRSCRVSAMERLERASLRLVERAAMQVDPHFLFKALNTRSHR